MCARAASLSCRLPARRGLATIALALVASVESSPTVSQDTAPAPKVQAAHKHVPSDSHRKLLFHTHTPHTHSPQTTCTNTCTSRSDGDCDDGGPGAQFSICDIGTDCVDCGPRPNRLPRCSSSGCGSCSNGPLTGTVPNTPNQYYFKTDYYFTCDACSSVASGGKMYIYQAYVDTGGSTAIAVYLWFDCSNGKWTVSVVPARTNVCPNRFACDGPYPTGTITYDQYAWSSCPYSGTLTCSASSPPPSTHSHTPHSHTPHTHTPHTHTPHTHIPPPPPSPPPRPPPPHSHSPLSVSPPPAPAGSSSLCQAPVGSYCCYDDPARPNYVCSAGFSCGRGVCVPAGSVLCGCSGQTYCLAGSKCCGSTCCPIGQWCGGDENSCACSRDAFPQPRDDLHCGSTPADVLLAARSPGYTPGAGSCGSGSGSEGQPPWFMVVSVGVPIALIAIVLVACVLVVCRRMKAARATTSQFVGGSEMRTVEVASATTYDMRLNEAFLSAAQPSSQSLVVAAKMPTTTPVFGADGKPIINTIPTTTPVFGADGKPIFNIIPATAINTVPATAISNTVPATTCVFGPDGNPIYMDD
jgi:hypothetical protein